MDTKHTRTLQLNAWYMPMRVITVEDAIVLRYKGLVDVVVEYDEEIRSPSVTWKVPAIVRLRRQTSRKKLGIKFSRENVYLRDNYHCLYCGKKYPARALSYDHVVPRAHGGKTEWGNIVTACRVCNALKADQTCDQSGMWPLRDPLRPKSLPMVGPRIERETAPAEWLEFLPAE